ncbi:MAG: hypothetical protein ACE5FJ_05755 [Gemmatimonadales bacterium]
MRLTFGVFVLAGAVAACGEDPVDPGLLPNLVGRWEWIYADGGISGIVITPESEGMTLSLVVQEDGDLLLIQDGDMVIATTYELLPAQDLDDVSLPRIRYGGTILGVREHFIQFDIEGRLMLRPDCCDQFTYVWARPESL